MAAPNEFNAPYFHYLLKYKNLHTHTHTHTHTDMYIPCWNWILLRETATKFVFKIYILFIRGGKKNTQALVFFLYAITNLISKSIFQIEKHFKKI